MEENKKKVMPPEKESENINPSMQAETGERAADYGAPEQAPTAQVPTAEQDNAQNEVSAEDAPAEAEERVGGQTNQACPERKKGIRAWWARHKPSKRRFIQIYSFLLYNAYARGFIKGEIFTGMTKSACVPGLNCYSCPGAVAACPLGALQNALTGTGHGSAYYMLGILLLYGLIFGRTICGFLCPMGLGQDLLYKIKTPKLKKSKITRVLSYFKYVLLVVLVVAVPIIYSIDKTAVPGFCKYVCPAGTLEGAIMLLIHPSNDSLYGMLGALFSWKTVVLVSVFTASIFIYRFFCRFLCPLGAIYGLFNRFALLGIKVDRSKCTNCGKCVDKCKMDIKSVGDHECINCGECISACPTKAIGWKGSKVFLKNVDSSLVKPVPTDIDASAGVPRGKAEVSADIAAVVDRNENSPCGAEVAATGAISKPRKPRGRAFWLKALCIALAAILYAGVFTYVNFFAAAEDESVEYLIAVDSADGGAGLVSFTIGGSDKPVSTRGDGDGTKDAPYEVSALKGRWDVPVDGTTAVYFKFTAHDAATYTVDGGENLELKIYYLTAGKAYALYDYQVDGNKFTLSLKAPEGYGNGVGDICYDFTLKGYNGVDDVTLSAYRGKVVVVNFWGTWCGPCVKELPEFEQVRAQYADSAVVIAVHSVYMSENGAVQRFLDDKKWNEWGILFAQDTGTKQKSDVFALLGGKTNAYPRTLVIDAEGVIRDAFDGEVSAQQLSAAVEKASDKN